MDSLSRTELSDDWLDVIVAVLLVLVGIGLLAHPLYLWPHYGQTGYAGFIEVLLRWYATAVSALLIAFGGMVLYYGSWRPLTPLRSLSVTAAVTIAFLATNAYDVLYSGIDGPLLGVSKLSMLKLIPVTSLFLAVGSEVARNGRASRVAIGGTVGIIILSIVIFNPTAIQIVVGLHAVVGGLPWFWLGYRLTDGT